jgi:hypothetical protein
MLNQTRFGSLGRHSLIAASTARRQNRGRPFAKHPLVQALAAALIAMPLTSNAATIVVTSSSPNVTDGALCTLRGAGYSIDSGANQNNCVATGAYGSNDTITFAPAVTLINLDSYGAAIYAGSPPRTIRGTGFGGVTLQRTAAASNAFPIINFAGGSSLTLDGLTIEGGSNTSGSGGGVNNSSSYGGDITITNSIIRNNTAVGAGGGVNGGYGGNITIINSAVTGNTAGSGGGGVVTSGGFNVSGSTISGNQSGSGGGLSFVTTCASGQIVSSTISGNTAASGIGSGVLIDANTSCGTAHNALFANNTIANNTGGSGGVSLGCYGGTISLSSNIIYGNSTADTVNFACSSTTLTGNNNVIGVAGGSGSYAGVTGTITANPLLAALANNGGNTQTHALGSGSPAIDAGNNAQALVTDQRGAGFPRTVGAGTDIGAFEVQAVAVAVPAQPVPLGGWMTLLATAFGLIASGWVMLRRRRF